jgi:hypothetical protein
LEINVMPVCEIVQAFVPAKRIRLRGRRIEFDNGSG